MRFVWVSLLGVMLAQAVSAGPWMREAGTGFLSFSTEYDPAEGSYFTSLYAEHGVWPRITAGVDLGFSDDALYKGILFGRMPYETDTKWVIALEMGVGVTEDEAVLRPGLSIGRGLELGKRSGWLAVDTLAYYQVERDMLDVSIDATLGVNMTDRHKLLLQLQSGNDPMEPDYLNFAPSLVIEKQAGLHLELGMKAALKDSGSYAVKMGIWREF